LNVFKIIIENNSLESLLPDGKKAPFCSQEIIPKFQVE